jgi:hypothetical protein
MAKAEEWLSRSTEIEMERKWIRARVLTGLGDEAWFREDVISARVFYKRALQQDSMMAKTFAKLALLPFGKLGYHLRRVLRPHRTTAQ